MSCPHLSTPLHSSPSPLHCSALHASPFVSFLCLPTLLHSPRLWYCPETGGGATNPARAARSFRCPAALKSRLGPGSSSRAPRGRSSRRWTSTGASAFGRLLECSWMLSRWLWECGGEVGAVRNFEVVDIQPFHKKTPWSEKLP